MRSGCVKSYGDKLSEKAAKVEHRNAAIDGIQSVCHGFGIAIGGIGLMYAVAVGCCLLIGAEIGLPWMVGALAAVSVCAVLMVM